MRKINPLLRAIGYTTKDIHDIETIERLNLIAHEQAVEISDLKRELAKAKRQLIKLEINKMTK